MRRCLPELCRGEKVGALAMTEAGSGSDAYSLRTRAERLADGFRLDGEKTLITNAPIADRLIVSALVGAEGRNSGGGVTAFLVEADRPGVELGAPFETMGLRTSPLGSVALRGVEVGEEAVLGWVGSGTVVFQEAMDWERTCLFAGHVGTMEWLLEAALARLRERKRGGAASGELQAASHRVADLKVGLEAARLLAYRAAWSLARGRSATLDAAIAKIFVSESLIAAVGDVFRILGGGGRREEVEIERRLRAAAAAASTIYSGTSEIQRNLIAGMLGL